MCFCIKRSMNPGFAGIENEAVLTPDRTFMLFGDAKQVVGELGKQLADRPDCIELLYAPRLGFV